MKGLHTYLIVALWSASLFIVSQVMCLGQDARGPRSTIQGQIKDPSGAVIQNAIVRVDSAHGTMKKAVTNTSGRYAVRELAPGDYRVTVTASGFASFRKDRIVLAPNAVQQFDVSLAIEVAEQQVQVDGESPSVGTGPASNANALVIKGKELDALSDDPDEMLNELQALAGPAAGPGGGQIYIDGFSGGQLPPKASIRAIRVNQNPFSAQFDRLGYGRIEILTKPGTSRVHGEISSRGNDSSFNSRNPLLSGAEPAYHSYDVRGSISGPLAKNGSYFFSILSRNHQNTSVVNATDPASITPSNPNGTLLSQALGNPNSGIDLSQRFDLQLGQANTLTFRYNLSRTVNTGDGVGQTNLPLQAYNTHNVENEFQIGDNLVLSKNVVDSLRLQYRRIRNQQTAQSALPTITVQGSFTDGGSNDGNVRDNQDDFEFQDYLTGVAGNHGLNFGARARLYRDANFSDAGANGVYTFDSTTSYLNRAPQTYAVTIVNNPTARVTLFDAALFYQDDWKVKPRLTLSYGLRWETQNRIHDKSDWAPRLSVAYALDSSNGKPARTVLRAGYGWFFQRFTVPSTFTSTSGTPYLVNVGHQNGFNQIGYTVTNPVDFQQSSPGLAIKPANPTAGTSAQTQYSVAGGLRAADDMQAAVGIDRQLNKSLTANLTYLSSRGVHQYLTNNLGAAPFPTAAQDIYPSQPLPAPTANRMQYQSGGVYRETQLIATLSAHYRRYSLFGFYTYSNAKGDTTGVTFVPSISQAPGLDYGRTSFDVHHRVVLAGSFVGPLGFSLSPMFVYNSGTPYNVTIGSDLTGNNQFNARPTFAAPGQCESGSTQYFSSPYGCLDTNPFGTEERIIPYGLGTGPANVALNLHLSKSVGIGPRSEEGAGTGPTGAPPPPDGGPGGLGPGGLTSNHGGPFDVKEASARRYTLTFDVMAHNVLNYENLGTPNGTLNSPPSLRFKSQSLAGGPFSPPEGGNRSIFLEVHFTF
jgi:Carboxypeptidase regulatory-like domain/TonB dependent receptor